MRIRFAILGLALVSGAVAAQTAPVPADFHAVTEPWLAASNEKDPARALLLIEQALALSPTNQALLQSAVTLAARGKDRAHLAMWLAALRRTGGSLGPQKAKALAAAFPELAGEVRALAVPVRIGEAGRTFATVPVEHDLVEGVAFDPASGQVIASDVHGRQILAGKGGVLAAFASLPTGSGSPMALVVDPARHVLLVAVDQDPWDKSKTQAGGLARISLADESSEMVRGMGDVHAGDIAVSRSGTAYLADSASGAVYRCRPGCAALETLLPGGRLRSAQGMIVAPDESWLWISDYGYGLVRLDLKSGETQVVKPGADMALDGIDGMALAGGRAVAVQNGWNVPRLVSIAFSADGRRATGLRVLAQDPASLSEPSQVSASGGRLLVIANAQWGRLDQATEHRAAAVVTRILAF